MASIALEADDLLESSSNELMVELKIDLDRARLATKKQQVQLADCQQELRAMKRQEKQRLLQNRERRDRIVRAQRLKHDVREAEKELLEEKEKKQQEKEKMQQRKVKKQQEKEKKQQEKEKKQPEKEKKQQEKEQQKLEDPDEIAARAEANRKGRAALLELRYLRNRFEESLRMEQKLRSQQQKKLKEITNKELVKRTSREAEFQFQLLKKSLQEAARKKSLQEAARKKSLQEAVIKKSLQEAARKKSLQEAFSKKSLQEAARKKCLQEAGSKKSLQEAGRKKSLQEATIKKSLQEATIKKSLPEATIKKSLPEAAAKKDPLPDQKLKEEIEATKKSEQELRRWEVLEQKIEEQLEKSSRYYKELRLLQSMGKLRREMEKREALEWLAKEELRRKCKRDLEEHEQRTREEREKKEIEERITLEPEASKNSTKPEEEEKKMKSEDTSSEKSSSSSGTSRGLSSSSSILQLLEKRSLGRRAWREAREMWEAAAAVRDQCLQEVERVEAVHKKAAQISSSPSSRSSSAGPLLSMVGQYCPSANDYLVDQRLGPTSTRSRVPQWRSPLFSYRSSSEAEEEEQERLRGGRSSPEAATISSVEEPNCLNLLQANGQIFSNLLETTNILNGHLEAHLGSGYDNEGIREVHREAKRMWDKQQAGEILQWRQLAVKLLFLLADQLHKYYDLVDTQFGLL